MTEGPVGFPGTPHLGAGLPPRRHERNAWFLSSVETLGIEPRSEVVVCQRESRAFGTCATFKRDAQVPELLSDPGSGHIGRSHEKTPALLMVGASGFYIAQDTNAPTYLIDGSLVLCVGGLGRSGETNFSVRVIVGCCFFRDLFNEVTRTPGSLSDLQVLRRNLSSPCSVQLKLRDSYLIVNFSGVTMGIEPIPTRTPKGRGVEPRVQELPAQPNGSSPEAG